VIANSLFITGCWKTTWTWIKETGGSPTENREKDKKSWKVFTQTTIGKCLCPGSHVESRFGRKDTGETKEKGVMQTKS
jgi:hypothetical protein